MTLRTPSAKRQRKTIAGAKTPQIKFTFKDAFPLQLSSVNFDTNVEAIQYLQADVTFAYRSYTIENLLNR